MLRRARLTGTETIRCRACAHTVEHVLPASSIRATAEESEGSEPPVVPELPFPVYGLEGEPGEFAGMTSDTSGVREFALGFDGVVVSSGPALDVDPRDALDDALTNAHEEPPPGTDRAVLTLDFHVAMERVARVAASAPIEEVRIPVDGVPTAFALAAAAGSWGADARIGDVTVRVAATGRHVGDVRLVRRDPG